MWRAVRILGALALLGGLLACSQLPGSPVPPTATPTAAPITDTADTAVSPLPYDGCGWAWANQNLPEITAALRGSLADAGLSSDPEGTYAYAFGENCLRPDGTVDHFAALETDFVVTITPPDPKDLAALGVFAGGVLRVILSDFAPRTVPGPQPGNVTFVFIADGGASHHQVALEDARAVLLKGLAGADLYQALFRQTPP